LKGNQHKKSKIKKIEANQDEDESTQFSNVRMRQTDNSTENNQN